MASNIGAVMERILLNLYHFSLEQFPSAMALLSKLAPYLNKQSVATFIMGKMDARNKTIVMASELCTSDIRHQHISKDATDHLLCC